MRWNTVEVLKRLRAVMSAVPLYQAGGGTQSTAFTGVLAYARDMANVQQVAREVMTGVCAPTPHPTFGDDGYRHEVRTTALEALDWAERWLEWRSASGWASGDEGRCNYRDRPWGDA